MPASLLLILALLAQLVDKTAQPAAQHPSSDLTAERRGDLHGSQDVS
jgi:hypothetical protein